MDTHRIWETLYMGSFPIVKKDINNWFYNKLPIFYINKWEDVNERLLNDMWADRDWGDNRNMLEFSYWKNKIMNVDL